MRKKKGRSIKLRPILYRGVNEVPKTKLQEYVNRLKNSEPDAPLANYIGDFFKRYMKAQGISTDKAGELLNCTGANVRSKLNNNNWRICDIAKFAMLVKCSREDLSEAIILSIFS